MREIVLDTETTGLDPREGHRIIEMAAVELDGVRIGQRWHSLFDPKRPIDGEATAVHGITNNDLKGQPTFEEQVDSFLAFTEGATLIAHNAPFDRGFIAAEMWRCKRVWEAQWIDTLPLARKKVPKGRGHSLDALCKHYGIRKTARAIHGAVLDTLLLAEVYVRLIGRLDQLQLDGMMGGERVWLRSGELIIVAACDMKHPGQRPAPLPNRLTLDEARAHKRFMQELEKDREHARENIG